MKITSCGPIFWIAKQHHPPRFWKVSNGTEVDIDTDSGDLCKCDSRLRSSKAQKSFAFSMEAEGSFSSPTGHFISNLSSVSSCLVSGKV
ncbi:hypothetical protein CK203_021461 [Vitis vinifera]|uniref:Uncharacterized protein n=1 Tax=Vitis vinifera TaxID=29760 RepID=A0A438ISM0_VITVI|nr:hypothetical protein CK203_021461 [Vitis vinifera]